MLHTLYTFFLAYPYSDKTQKLRHSSKNNSLTWACLNVQLNIMMKSMLFWTFCCFRFRTVIPFAWLYNCSKIKVKCDHRSKFSNLSNWKEEAWKKNQGFNGIRTRDLRDTGAMLYQLSYEATHWERGQFIEFISSRAVKWCEVYMK